MLITHPLLNGITAKQSADKQPDCSQSVQPFKSLVFSKGGGGMGAGGFVFLKITRVRDFMAFTPLASFM